MHLLSFCCSVPSIIFRQQTEAEIMPVCPQTNCLLPPPAAVHRKSSSFDGDASLRSAYSSCSQEPADMKMVNNIAGEGVAGILYKWVNYGKGWRTRWFMLQDGVLSYYKIHGPHKIAVNRRTEKGVRVIGDESLKLMKKPKNMHGTRIESRERRQPFGEVHLKTEKVDLETTVVDESQSYSKSRRASLRSRHEKCSDSATESDDDNDRQDGADEESDEDDGAYFDTRDILSSTSSRRSDSGYRRTSVDSEEGLTFPNNVDVFNADIETVGFDYPNVERRRKLPDPKEKEKGVSLWSMIKDNIGKDLTKVCLPVYFNEPLSSLEKCFEDLEYSYLLDRAYEWGKQGNSLLRILNVAAFAVSGYACTEGRNCKPFNPLLGETYEADYQDKGLRFISEKVSHHPMTVACHCEGRGWKFWGDSTLKSKFWGRSIQLDPEGVLTLEFDDGEVFEWSKVTTSIYNLILGKLYCEHYGTMRIQGNREHSCKLKFKEQSMLDRNPHQVQGVVQDRSGNTVSTLLGKWDENMYYVNGDINLKSKRYDPSSEAILLWESSKPSNFSTRYNFTSFAITLNELTPGLKEKLPPTDSRLRPDQRHLENGEYELANAEKLRLEQRQRQARKLQERGWQPRWFRKENGKDTYQYIGGYWETREQGKWDSCLDIFGQTAESSYD
ncbi:oxysterol-binding protein-related protein 1C isoform X4 [Cryptomeria japonica]|uniref:oxysterol-binding protein-related protein 1C isoform X4 n=1 Tax=Cryptomeria japonica TaxID=3369 RepID=UPI0027DA0FA1|nr:oxysterol-binding protein-related protein 1C isoform X4 [Cryptomeria japonica]